MASVTEPYCSVEDYQMRYGAVDDLAQLEECLMDATRLLAVELGRRGIDAADVDDGLLMQACRQMANRVVPTDAAAVPAGATNVSRTVGPYTYQLGFSRPFGSPKVTDAELDLLGLGARIGWARIGGGAA